jgi:hypothetical protein
MLMLDQTPLTSTPTCGGGFKFRNEHHLCSESRRGGCNGNDGS